MSDPARQRWYLREWRKHRGLTIEKLAEIVNRSKGYLSHIERGEKRYNQDLLEELSHALGCEPADLLGRDPDDGATVWQIWEAIPEARKPLALDVLRTFAEPEGQGRTRSRRGG